MAVERPTQDHAGTIAPAIELHASSTSHEAPAPSYVTLRPTLAQLRKDIAFLRADSDQLRRELVELIAAVEVGK